MAKFAQTLIAASVLAAVSAPVFAADYSGDIHKNDYKWLQFNVMHAIDQRPYSGNDYNDTYLEMEFGGRSGLFDLYGYVDVFDIFDSKHSNKHGTGDGKNIFMKFAPRLSLDALTGKDLSFGPVQEVYIATLNSVDDTMMENMIGLGTDVQVPWFGKVGMNLYARHATESGFAKEEGKWNGYQFSMNWFKPFYTFANGSFISYQGYLDYLFDRDTYGDTANYSSHGLGTFHGIYWHSDRYAVGYGLKYFNEIYGINNGAFGGALNNTGFGHYFSVTYKF